MVCNLYFNKEDMKKMDIHFTKKLGFSWSRGYFLKRGKSPIFNKILKESLFFFLMNRFNYLNFAIHSKYFRKL